ISLELELAVLAPKPLEFLALRRGQAVSTPARIAIGLGNPVPDRLCRRFKLLGQLLRRTAGVHQFDHLLTEFRCIRWSRLPHRGLLEHKCSDVHETGSTSGAKKSRRTAHHRRTDHRRRWACADPWRARSIRYAGYGGQRGWFGYRWSRRVGPHGLASSCGQMTSAHTMGAAGLKSALGRLGRVLSIRWPK